MVPTRNRWSHLSTAALPAALRQEAVDLELLVIDDGSTDGTAQALAELRDDRLRTIRNERPEGVARARNRGIAEARAPWIAFLDDDDLWSPRKLRAQLDAAAAAEADFAYAAAVFVDEQGTVLRPDPAPDPRTVARALRGSDVVGGPSTVLARTALLRKLGGFEPTLSVLADWELWLRLAEAGRAAACPEVLVAYTEHGANMSAASADRAFRELDVLMERHGLARDLDGVRFTRWLASHQRRGGARLAAARIYLRGALRHRSLGLAGAGPRRAVRRACDGAPGPHQSADRRRPGAAATTRFPRWIPRAVRRVGLRASATAPTFRSRLQ